MKIHHTKNSLSLPHIKFNKPEILSDKNMQQFLKEKSENIKDIFKDVEIKHELSFNKDLFSHAKHLEK